MQRKIWLIVGLILGLSGITLQAKSVREHYSEFSQQCRDTLAATNDNPCYIQGNAYNIYSNYSFRQQAAFILNGLRNAVIFEHSIATAIKNEQYIKDIVLPINNQPTLGSQTKAIDGKTWLEHFCAGTSITPDFIQSNKNNIVFVPGTWLNKKFDKINLTNPHNFFRLVERLADIVARALAANPGDLVAAKIAADREADELAQRLTCAQSWKNQQAGGPSPDEMLNQGHEYRKYYGSAKEVSFDTPLPSAPYTETDDEDINQR